MNLNIIQQGVMSYRRASQHDGWSSWLRKHRQELIDCGLPPEAYRTETDWYLFLDHGYVQSTDVHIADWWSINMLDVEQTERLRSFLVQEYGNEHPQLVQSLAALAAKNLE